MFWGFSPLKKNEGGQDILSGFYLQNGNGHAGEYFLPYSEISPLAKFMAEQGLSKLQARVLVRFCLKDENCE